MKHISFIKFALYLTFLTKVALLVVPTLSVVPIDWLVPLYESVIYIALGIFLFRADSLQPEYNIDILSLIIFILAGTLFRISEPEISNLWIGFRVLEWLIAGILLIRIITKKIPARPFKWADLKWTVIGAISGVLLALPSAYLIVYGSGLMIESVDVQQYTTPLFIFNLLIFTSMSEVEEEIIFRGLLFGYLTKQSNNEWKSLLVQTLIFWLFHFDKLWVYPLAFWFIPLSALSYGLLVWRSRSLSPAIVAHMLLNTFVTIFSVVIASK